MAISCTATVASIADPEKQSCFPECAKETSESHCHQVVLQTEAQHQGNQNESTKSWIDEEMAEKWLRQVRPVFALKALTALFKVSKAS